ncbi:hypothetical protein evm_005424 [Chilo suppressalis]|nr:hypothetical protein evm_005424 [Chilo suppressalis]
MFILFFLYVIQCSANPLPMFPDHVDLQKLGEVIINNATYNVLKPTTHVITDHFKDAMLRTDTKRIPSKKVFIDNNGFRHYWSGFEDKNDLRKSNAFNVDNLKVDVTLGDTKNTDTDKSKKDKVATDNKRNHPKRLKDIPLEPVTPGKIILRQSGVTTTLAKTTFFCPFIGVMTMTSRLD